MEKQVIIPLGEYEELIQYKEKTPCVLITHDYGPNYYNSGIDTIKITPLNQKSLMEINEIVEQYKKDIDSRFDKAVDSFREEEGISKLEKSMNSGKKDGLTLYYLVFFVLFFVISILELIYIICKH